MTEVFVIQFSHTKLESMLSQDVHIALFHTIKSNMPQEENVSEKFSMQSSSWFQVISASTVKHPFT